MEYTTDINVISKVMTNKVLFEASMPDEDLEALQRGEWIPALDCQYVVYKLDEEPIAIIRLYNLSNITVDMHVHLLPDYWGGGYSTNLQKDIEKFLTKNSNYCKIVIQTPQCCRNVLQAATREGFKLEGILTHGIYWRGNIENIVLMAKNISRSQDLKRQENDNG